MDIGRLHEILAETTLRFRKLETFARPGAAVDEEEWSELERETMPHVSEAPAGLEHVDLELLVVGVDRQAAARHRAELIELLKCYPRPHRLRAGLSYVELANDIGSRAAALQLFALGRVLGLWDLITPAQLRTSGRAARYLARIGILVSTPFDPGGA